MIHFHNPEFKMICYGHFFQWNRSDFTLKVFEKEKIQLLRGPYGPYIKQGLRNFKLTKEQQEKVEDLTIEEVKEIIEELKKNPPRKTARKKKA